MKTEKLLFLRKQKGLKQKDLAELLNVTRQQYQRCESGLNELDYSGLIKVAKFYNVSIDYLLGYSSSEPNIDFLESRFKELNIKQKEELLTRLIKLIIEECK